MKTKQKITPCLWFDGQAEQAAAFYVSIFKNSKITDVSHYSEAGKEQHEQEPGSAMVVAFELDGQAFTGLNGGPTFKFSEAISFQIDCETQEDVDHFWNHLSEGGPVEAQQCGWVKDKFGVSWQVVPSILMELLGDPDREKANRTMSALMQMKKLDIATLKRAHAGE
ncbi:MAG: VOC family protein [Verrucomicrobiota bacterium]